eukprot:1138063-Pelagomonas_calceolata.AAC.2
MVEYNAVGRKQRKGLCNAVGKERRIGAGEARGHGRVWEGENAYVKGSIRGLLTLQECAGL